MPYSNHEIQKLANRETKRKVKYNRSTRYQDFLERYHNFDWNKLNDLEVSILKLYFKHGETLETIGEMLGISKQAVGKRKTNAIKKGTM